MVFQGEFDHSVDDKGRVIIPAKFRSSLGERFYMTKGFDKCISVYTDGAYKDLSEALAKQPPLDEHSIRLQRFQGRVAIPSKLRDWAKIGEQGDVVIVGTGSRIEIWSQAVWNRYNDDLTDAMITESAREVGIA